MASDGRLQKMEVNYSDTVDQKLPECEEMARNGKLEEAIEALSILEKQTRMVADVHLTSTLLVAIVKMCFESKNWKLLTEQIITLTKKKSQLKQSVTKMVQEAYGYIDETPDKETKLALIETLITVTKGKIYVEVERARLTRILAKIKEDDGMIEEAANALQEVQVETFGSMEKKEKVEFILEQMRLCLVRKNYIRTQIISKKISPKFFDDSSDQVQQLKLKFYKLMIEVDLHESAYLATCKHFRAIYVTPCVQQDAAHQQEILKSVVLYVLLAPYDNEQSDLLYRIKEDKTLEDIPKYKDILSCFTTQEVMLWAQVCKIYEKEIRDGSAASPATDVFASTTAGIQRWNDLKKRVIEHNIRVMAKYYMQVTLGRMAELLDLPEKDTEEFLSTLVSNGTIYAKIDRLAGIVNFQKQKDPNEILNDWSHNLNKLMSLVSSATHLINKEEMTHRLS